MISFPDDEPRRHPVFAYAVAISLLVHLLIGVVAVLQPWHFLRSTTPPKDEFASTADRITLETPQPRIAQHRPRVPPPRPNAPHAVARPRRIAAQPIPVPTLAPPATAPPSPTPHRVAQATIHRPASTGETGSGAPRRPSAFSQEQIAQMESQFSRTIAQTRQDLSNVPLPATPRPASRRKYDLIMAGKPEDLVNFQGECNNTSETQGVWQTRDGEVYRYLTCRIDYSDGYSETVSFPWPFHWSRQNDPFATHRHFAIQSPPGSFNLPTGMQLSRAVCIYFKDRCGAIFKKEIDLGGRPGG